MREYHKQIDKRMFDFSDFYARVAREMPQDATIAEVGIADGASVIFLAETLLNLGKRFKLYAIDDMSYGHEKQLRTVMQHIGRAGLGADIELVPVSSAEATCRFPDLHFDFVFIDASHQYEPTKTDIIMWYRKLKEGGYLAGHDYNSLEGLGVKQAVDELIPKKYIRTDVSHDQSNRRALETYPTANGCNVWAVRKKFFLRIPQC